MIKRVLILSIIAFAFLSLKVPEVYLFTPENIYSGSNCENHLVMESVDLHLSKDSNYRLFGFEIENAKSAEIYIHGKQIHATDTVEICKSLKIEVRFRQTKEGDGILKFHSDIPGQKNKHVKFDRQKLFAEDVQNVELVVINSSYNCTERLELEFPQVQGANAAEAYIYKRGKLIKALNKWENETNFVFPVNSKGLYKVVYRPRWFRKEFAVIFK